MDWETFELSPARKKNLVDHQGYSTKNPKGSF